MNWLRLNWLQYIPLLLAAVVHAQTSDVIYDESLVPKYTLPDALTMRNGDRVRDSKTWTGKRRPEILEIYQTEVYGRSPARAAKLNAEITSIDKQALEGKAIRKQVTLYFSAKNGEKNLSEGKRMDILIYLPVAAKKPVPLILGLSFSGNQTVTADTGIKLGEEWVKGVKQPAAAKSRGAQAQQWQVDQILAHGYGLATIYYGDIEPDFNGGMQYGIRPLFFKPGQTEPAADEWGAIAAWAWGLSRAMDYLETDHEIDAGRVAVFGHSRLGKAALWAGAQDTRFSLIISNESGEGGAAISRRDFGERTKDLNSRFPHWFDANFKKYSDHEDQMPFDSNLLLSLIAPRPLYVASAEGDRWSDPRGEFLGALGASPVYELFGKKGLGTDQMPGNHQPIMHTVAYHIRAGKHDVTEYDWEQYLKFADAHWGRGK